MPHVVPAAVAPYVIKDGRILNNHVEVNVAEHCNMTCKACSHLSPIMAKRLADPADVYRDLHALAPSYHAERVTLLGGEPLLHPDIAEVARAARRSGVSDIVSVVTNGTLLGRMGEEFWEAVDHVRVSAYPGREPSPELLAECRLLAERHAVVLQVCISPTFREAFSTVGTTDTALVRQIYATCSVAHEWRCHVVADGYFYRCPQSYFLPRGLPQANLDPLADGIEISNDPSFQARLLAFLESPEPLQSCRFCLGTAGIRFAHHEVPRKGWADQQAASVEHLLDPLLVAGARVDQPRG